MGGFPSIFCFTFMRTKGHEKQILKGQVQRRLGIFACDDFLVVSNREISLGQLPDQGAWKTKGAVRTVKIHAGTAKGVKLFRKVWDAVTKDGRYLKHDWTVKINPATVLLPGRLRVHLKEKTFPGALQYVKNCNPKAVGKGRRLNEKEDTNEKENKMERKHKEKNDKDEKVKKVKKDKTDKNEEVEDKKAEEEE